MICLCILGGVTNCTIEHNYLRNTGDDSIAMWSQASIGADEGNTIAHNTVQLPILANGIAVYGGISHQLLSNSVADTIQQGGGIHFGARFASTPLAGTHSVIGNTLTRCGDLDENWRFGIGALWFYAQEKAMNAAVQVKGLLVQDSPYEAIQFIGQDVTDVAFEDVRVINVGTFVLQLQANSGSASFRNVTATGVGYFGQYYCGTAGTFSIQLEGSLNSGFNTTHCGFPPAPPPAPGV
jgi:hypothetical protein